MNLPFQKIHDGDWSYGRLLLPLFGGRWLGYFRTYGLKRTSRHGFHNCTITGVY